MAYKTIRRDGRNITIDTTTGKEVGVGQGQLKPIFDALGLSNLNETLPLTLKQMGADIQNLPGDISRHLIYSDKVDEKGRPLTIAQANPQPRKLIPEIESYLAREGKSKPVGTADMKTIREKMIKDAGGLEQYKKLYPAAAEGGYTISPKVRKKLAEERVKPTPVPETITSTAPVYNAKERVKKHGVKKAEDMAMMEWAKAHKGLAEKVKPGQAGYDAIQLALGKTTVEPEEIRGFMDDSGMSAEEARARLSGGSVETVIDGNKPMVTTINPAVAAGGSEVEIPTANFSGMSQAMQDLVGPSLEAGAAFNINVDNVLNQNDPQAFLMEQLKKIQGINR